MAKAILALYRSATQPAMAEAGRALESAAARPGLSLLATEDPGRGRGCADSVLGISRVVQTARSDCATGGRYSHIVAAGAVSTRWAQRAELNALGSTR